MVKFVEKELHNIRKEVNDMWVLVYQQFESAYKAVMDSDYEAADKVVAREKRVNAFELKIDSDIEDFIALYNPVAIDLRFALAMLKINNNLERIGDYADSIARFVIRSQAKPEDKAFYEKLQLREMFETVLMMLNTTYESLRDHSIAQAKSVFEKDETLDQINQAAITTLAAYASNTGAPSRSKTKSKQTPHTYYLNPGLRTPTQAVSFVPPMPAACRRRGMQCHDDSIQCHLHQHCI